MEKKKLLFVISNPHKQIGGHIISGITLARQLAEKGYDVGVLTDSPMIEIYEMQTNIVRWHLCTYGKYRLIAYFLRRTIDIFRVVYSQSYDCIIGCDTFAVKQSWLPAIIKGISIVQFCARGAVPEFCDQLRLPGIVVIMEKVKNSYIEKYRIPEDFIILSPSRVDFKYFASLEVEAHITFGSGEKGKKVLCVSRLIGLYAPAIVMLLNEVLVAATRQPIQLLIVGDGEAKGMLKKKADEIMELTGGAASIRFVGALRVNGADLRQADLVVGMGRTVIEAIASRVPAAVIGQDKYCGLITSDVYPEFSRANFSGIGINLEGSLITDLNRLEEYSKRELDEVYRLVYHEYDAAKGAENIETAWKKIDAYSPTPLALRWNYLRALLIHFVDRFRLERAMSKTKYYRKVTMRDVIIGLLRYSRLTDLACRLLIANKRITILFHGISRERMREIPADAQPHFSVEEFRKVIGWLKDNFELLTPEEFLADEKRGALLTFDDGLANNFTNALPVLEEFSAPAVFFITTQHVQDPLNWLPATRIAARKGWGMEDAVPDDAARDFYNGLSLQQLTGFSLNPLVTIGSHTVSHPFLTRCDAKTIQFELAESKSFLESVTGRRVDLFAYPTGDYDRTVAEAVSAAGYRAGFAVGNRKVGLPGFEIPRAGIYYADPAYISLKLIGLHLGLIKDTPRY